MGHFCTQEAAARAVGLYTQADWERLIKVIRRNTPPRWRNHTEFQSTANECLAEAIRSFDPERGVPFEGFLARVARLRVPEQLRRYARGDVIISIDEERVSDDYAAQHGNTADLVMSVQDSIANLDSTDVIWNLADTLPQADRQTLLLLAAGLTPTEVAKHRNVGRSAVSNSISRIRSKIDWAA
jgi:RNA polymerase sigma factor (sigma-70 family)